MIAWASDTPPGVKVVDRGKWLVVQQVERSPLPEVSRYDLQQPVPIRKGFRSPPLNPRKRVKSKKS
jgi:hypothetical protein